MIFKDTVERSPETPVVANEETSCDGEIGCEIESSCTDQEAIGWMGGPVVGIGVLEASVCVESGGRNRVSVLLLVDFNNRGMRELVLVSTDYDGVEDLAVPVLRCVDQ